MKTPEQLRVFPQDADFPRDAVNGRIDQDFVPMAKVDLPKDGAFETWKSELLAKLRRMTFNHFPERIPPAQAMETGSANEMRLSTEPGIKIRLRAVRTPPRPERVLLIVTTSDANDAGAAWIEGSAKDTDAIFICEPRGVGSTRWTQKNPPNTVARSHSLFGRTVDSGRIWDIVASARYLKMAQAGKCRFIWSAKPMSVSSPTWSRSPTTTSPWQRKKSKPSNPCSPSSEAKLSTGRTNFHPSRLPRFRCCPNGRRLATLTDPSAPRVSFEVCANEDLKIGQARFRVFVGIAT